MADGLIVECVRRGGYRKGARVASFIHGWAMAEGELGHKLGIEEFGRYWGPGQRRTAYRRMAEFRELFADRLPPGGTPSDLIEWDGDGD